MKRLKPLLGTFVEIGTSSNSTQAEIGISKAFEAIEKIQNLLSFHDPKSDLSVLNQNPGVEVQLHSISIRVLQLAQLMTKLSGGLFNLTSGGKLVQLGSLPVHSKDPVLSFGDADDLLISKNNAILKQPVQITLDGIAKGYAVDMAIRELKRHKLSGGWVNAGGDLRVFGDHQLPVVVRGFQGQMIAIGIVQDSAIATSATHSNPEPRFPGKIVSPFKESLPSGVWTVKAKFAWKADALTKVACLAPADVRGKLIEQLGGELLLDGEEEQ